MHDGRVATGEIENLQVAADVIAVRDEVRFWRNGDADVAELAALGDRIVVGADEQTDINGIWKRQVAKLPRDEAIAESRHRHQIDPVATLELDFGVHRNGKAVGRTDLFGGSAGGATKLERRQAVAVHGRGDVR